MGTTALRWRNLTKYWLGGGEEGGGNGLAPPQEGSSSNTELAPPQEGSSNTELAPPQEGSSNTGRLQDASYYITLVMLRPRTVGLTMTLVVLYLCFPIGP